MNKMTGNQVRQAFLDFFKEKQHMIEPGASLVPINDPTLLWINSGVAALKKYFDGSVKPSNNRIANAQKCIRTNDIENVGKTARHHTFFEMLGNFSIGDYFKDDAIPFAWEFLTSDKWMGFDPEKIYVSVHPDDKQAYDIWVEKIGFPKERILKSYDNYWQIGDGPCGPNSELYYDRGPKYDPEGLGEKLFFEEIENDRYIEVWNVVFSQYDGVEGVDRKEYKELPQKNIDTGMGLERLVSIVQGVDTNFDTDLFLPIIEATEKFTDIKYNTTENMAYRVIADHLRTVTFALADGALFSNDGRGYVLRRVLRRAIRHSLKLNINQSFMYKLVDVVAKNMEAYYPYLNDKVEYVAKMVKAEEDRFHMTLADGENLLKQLIASGENKVLKGKDVFKLYDTYGFPLELTKEIAAEKGLEVDVEGFNVCMEEQRQRARDSRENSESMSSQSVDLMNFKADSTFDGYQKLNTMGKVIGLFKDGKKVESLSDEGFVVFDHTVFYAESGGQVADSGVIKAKGLKAMVVDVHKAPFKQHLLKVKVESGELKVGMECEQQVDVQRRTLITFHHSCAHLLQSALRKVLGTHITQAGSYVSDEYLRFDFTHFTKATNEELEEIELIVNQYISQANYVETEVMDIESAKAKGAIALFDEKYGDQVRVVKMGEVSLELCGGCHVHNTSEIGVFKLMAEESIGSGIRRITGCASIVAYKEFKKLSHQLEDIASKVKANSVKLIDGKLNNLLNELEQLHNQNSNLQQKLIVLEGEKVVDTAVDNGETRVLFIKASNEISDLKVYVENVNRKNNGVVFAYQITDKVVFACACSQEAIAKGYQAGNLVKKAAVIMGGNGGGRPDLAQAGAKSSDNLKIMIDEINKELKIN